MSTVRGQVDRVVMGPRSVLVDVMIVRPAGVKIGCYGTGGVGGTIRPAKVGASTRPPDAVQNRAMRMVPRIARPRTVRV